MGATAEACSRPATDGINGDPCQTEVQAMPWNQETVEQHKTGNGTLDAYISLQLM